MRITKDRVEKVLNQIREGKFPDLTGKISCWKKYGHTYLAIMDEDIHEVELINCYDGYIFAERYPLKKGDKYEIIKR